MITGEKLQSLAEISLCEEVNCIINEQRIKTNIHTIDSIDDITQYKKIFVYTHALEKFFEKFYDQLDNITLISHNSDHCVTDKFLKYLEGDNIKKWFCQNRLTSHTKLFSIPIGMANSQWPHGNQELIRSIKCEPISKHNTVFKNFDINTNRSARILCDTITRSNGIRMSPHTTNQEYWRNIHNSRFVISPPGNGIDCHRIWEALYLECIPIVLDHLSFSQFKHLPILFVNKWEEVTEEFLNNKIEDFRDITINIPELTLDFWRYII